MIALLDFDRPPPGFEIRSRVECGREVFRYYRDTLCGEPCEHEGQALALAWNQYKRETWPPGSSGPPTAAFDRAYAWARYERRAILAKRLDAEMLDWQVGEDEDVPASIWPRCYGWSDLKVDEEERRLAQRQRDPDLAELRSPSVALAHKAAADRLASTVSMNFGRCLRSARLKAGVSLRDLAAALGLSHVFVGEVERGRQGLAHKHWPRLLEVLPGLDPRQLEHLDRVRLPLRLDLTSKPSAVQELCLLFAERIDAGDLTSNEVALLRSILSRREEQRG